MDASYLHISPAASPRRHLPGPGLQSAATVRRRAVECHERRRIRVLLADDHQILRQGLARLLAEQKDMEVVGEVADGESAVEYARQLVPDVVIMDVRMPRLDGIEATRRIVAELPEVRVVGLSMHAEEDMAAAMRKAGAAVYLTKSGSIDMLLIAVRGKGAEGFED